MNESVDLRVCACLNCKRQGRGFESHRLLCIVIFFTLPGKNFLSRVKMVAVTHCTVALPRRYAIPERITDNIEQIARVG